MWSHQGLWRRPRLCPGSKWKSPQILVPVLFFPIFLFYFIFCWGKTQQGVLILSTQCNELVCMYIPHNSTRLVEEWAPPSRGLSQAPTQAAADPQANYSDFYHCGKGFAYSQTSYKWKLNMDSVSGFFCWTLHLGDSTKLLRAAVVCSFPLNCSILSLEYHHSLYITYG